MTIPCDPPVHSTDPLDQAIEAAARSPVLLVATDYDGTLAPILEDPAEAKPLRESLVALRALAALPGTYAAITFVILVSVVIFAVLERVEQWLRPSA